MTNYERTIKNLNVEKMASKLDVLSDFICDNYRSCECCPFNFIDGYCCTYDGFLNWLNDEVEK